MINSSNLRSLSQLDLFQATKNVLSFMQDANLVSLQLKKVYDELLAAFNAFDQAIIQARKTGYTELLNQYDKDRDAAYRSIVAYLKGCVALPDLPKANAAKDLLTIIEKYPHIPSLPLRDETAAITNLVQDLKTTDANSKLVLLGVDGVLNTMDTKNREFEDTYNLRTEKEALIEVEVGKKTRQALEDAFRNVAGAINGLEVAVGEELYRVLSDQINREVSKAKQ